MGEITLEKFRPLLNEAVAAFQTDPSYAIAMAKQAGTLLTRKESKKKKLALEAGFLSSSGV